MSNGEQQNLTNSWVSTFKTENPKHNTNYDSNFPILTEQNLDNINSLHNNDKNSSRTNENSTNNNLSDSLIGAESTMSIRNEQGEKIKFDSDNDTIGEDLYESSVQSSERSIPYNADRTNNERDIKTPTNSIVSENLDENCEEIVIGDVEKKAKSRDLSINEVKNILSKINTSVPMKYDDEPVTEEVMESIKCKDVNENNKDICEPSIQSSQNTNPNAVNESSDVDENCEIVIKDATKVKAEKLSNDEQFYVPTIQSSQNTIPDDLNETNFVNEDCKEVVIGDIDKKDKGKALSIDEVKNILSKINTSVPMKYEEETNINAINEEIQCQNVEKLRQSNQSNDLDESIDVSKETEGFYDKEIANGMTPTITSKQFAPYPDDSINHLEHNNETDRIYDNTAPYPSENMTSSDYLERSKFNNNSTYSSNDSPYPTKDMTSSDYMEKSRLNNNYGEHFNESSLPYPSNLPEISTTNDNQLSYPTDLPEISATYNNQLPYPTDLPEISASYDTLPYQSEHRNNDFDNNTSYLDKTKKLIGFEPISISLEDKDKNADLKKDRDRDDYKLNLDDNPRKLLNDSDKGRGKSKYPVKSDIRTDLPFCNKCYKRHSAIDDRVISSSMYSNIRPLPKRQGIDTSKLSNKPYRKQKHSVKFDIDSYSTGYSSASPSKLSPRFKSSRNDLLSPSYQLAGEPYHNFDNYSTSPTPLSPNLNRANRYSSYKPNYNNVGSPSILSPRLNRSQDALLSPRFDRRYKYEIDNSTLSPRPQSSYKHLNYRLKHTNFDNSSFQSKETDTMQQDPFLASPSSVKHIISKYLTDSRSNREPNFLNNYNYSTKPNKLRQTPNMSRIQYKNWNYDKPLQIQRDSSLTRWERDSEPARSPLSPRRQLEDNCVMRVYCRGKLIHDPI